MKTGALKSDSINRGESRSGRGAGTEQILRVAVPSAGPHSALDIWLRQQSAAIKSPRAVALRGSADTRISESFIGSSLA